LTTIKLTSNQKRWLEVLHRVDAVTTTNYLYLGQLNKMARKGLIVSYMNNGTLYWKITFIGLWKYYLRTKKLIK
jgi:hypothetical protein